MAQEQAAFAAMLSALTPEEQDRARFAEIFTGIVAEPQKDGNFFRQGARA